jgi:glutamate 5-kinase
VRIYHGEREIARGLTQYSATDLRRIMGKRSTAIADILGYEYGAEAVHRDDLVLVAREETRES